ncbi:electron transfer flavoprotein beta subunit [Candidatus Kinetoplastibacterium oncopeltii TCC290E]|uniref:Electron transfer flavoprotein subunit beta n=1 Tax=Candidatus Kinetoplastidibacterium stringomonadis TCC290E TaxID=1208920 RepID=M1LS87_9PROT|nr:electron transfer flavoprotein subunit beta/FixA family protein [Candidatus Kinetoplastibacterium oncopeltii]AGF48412.1 electron transfer flavoprotein beta subunit [Candidatus Kinetoplastibacterium oncopeltii TCC290E]
MKVLVTVKSVIDHNTKIEINNDCSTINSENSKLSMNPFDEVALEEAIILKEKGFVDEIVALSCGDINSKDILKTAMAMGADRGILIESKFNLQPLSVAKAIKHIVDKEFPKIVILGKQAIDDDSCQTGQILSSLLGWPQINFVSNINICIDNLIAIRELDNGTDMISTKLPAVIIADLNLNKPRYITLQNLLRSKNKKIEMIDMNDICIDYTPRIELLKIEELQYERKRMFKKDAFSLSEIIKSELGELDR